MDRELDLILDDLIDKSSRIFNEFLCAYTIHSLGQTRLNEINEDVSVTVPVASKLELEPIPIRELITFNKHYPDFLLESFHGDLVQLWNNCLEEIFSLLVDLHFNNKRKFSELKKRNTSIDFSSTDNILEQIRVKMKKDFAFERFSEKQKLINKILNPKNKREELLLLIRKNVLIRNAVQHHEGRLYSDMLKELGNRQLIILDSKGNEKIFSENDKLIITIPELYKFKSAILSIGQIWRVNKIG